MQTAFRRRCPLSARTLEISRSTKGSPSRDSRAGGHVGMRESVLRPGDRCGDNAVVGLLGEGGCAQVYEVIDATGERRALKILSAEPSTNPKVLARIAQEGALLSLIEHVNVVRIYDAGIHEGHVWLLLELVEGQSLRETLCAHKGRPPVEATLRWLRQACEGVAEAHKIGAIHRDLKPENILITPSGLVKVIDFGIAKFRRWGIRTTEEQRLGTALYMAPDQLEGRPPDARMDVYAMGLVLYEAIAGKHPIVDRPASLFEVCSLQLAYRPPPLATVARDIPVDLARAVDRAIEKAPDLRCASMQELSCALQDGLVKLTATRRAAVRSVLGAPLEVPDNQRVAPEDAFEATEDATTRIDTQRPAKDRFRLSSPPATQATEAPTSDTQSRARGLVAIAVVTWGLAAAAWGVVDGVGWARPSSAGGPRVVVSATRPLMASPLQPTVVSEDRGPDTRAAITPRPPQGAAVIPTAPSAGDTPLQMSATNSRASGPTTAMPLAPSARAAPSTTSVANSSAQTPLGPGAAPSPSTAVRRRPPSLPRRRLEPVTASPSQPFSLDNDG